VPAVLVDHRRPVGNERVEVLFARTARVVEQCGGPAVADEPGLLWMGGGAVLDLRGQRLVGLRLRRLDRAVALLQPPLDHVHV
jgi:hypothetical protein